MRWSAGLPLLNVPSSGIVWRGPASNIQVTLSDRPCGWQTTHAPHDSCDMRPCGPRPEKNNSAPSCVVASAVAGAGGGDDCSVSTMAGLVGLAILITVIERLT